MDARAATATARPGTGRLALVAAALGGAGAACYAPPSPGAPCAITCTDACPGELSCVNGFCARPDDVCAPTLQRVSAGEGYACALDEASRLWCWGTNARHQIDESDRPQLPSPTLIGTGAWDAIATGGHACGIAGGRLYCWGPNDRGQVSGAIAGDVARPVEIQVAGGPARWDVVAVGHDATCAIGDGRLYCWGAGDAGVLGTGAAGDTGAPTLVATDLTDWTAVSIGWGPAGAGAGAGHACALSASAGLWCWGANGNGQLGDGTTSSRATPAPVALPSPPVAVAAGAYSTCATTASSELYCWGYAGAYALGDPALIQPNGNRLTPALASGLPGWTRIASAEEWACALRGGDAWCWGSTRSGAGLGNGVWGRGRVWGRVAGGVSDLAVGSSSNVDDAGVDAADLDLACVVAGGEVRCWGDNRYGQLGLGAAAQAAAPARVAGQHRWSALAAGGAHACGVADGAALCWGSTVRGQASGVTSGTSNAPCGAFAGQVCDVPAPAPLALPVGGPITEIAAGVAHGCARGAQIACWGDDAQGQLGAPGLGPAPVEVGGAWTALLPVRGNAQCAAAGDQVSCWGSIGSAQAAQMPTRVAELDGSTAIGLSETIAGGSFGHGCYLDPSRALLCLGDNTRGQFGNGVQTGLACGNGACDAGETSATCALDCGASPMTRLPRTYRALGVGWAPAGDSAFTCGVREDGRIECWGKNRASLITDAIDPGTGQPVEIAYTPVEIAGLEGCTAVAAGDSFACALCGGGAWCWGDHRRGAVGSGAITAAPVRAPRQVDAALAPGDAWAELTAGAGFACGRTTNGDAYCWGASLHGALGTGAGAANLPAPLRFGQPVD